MLEGVRVIDLSRVLAGPWATQLLADLGADVIKIERPGCGDDTRAWGPPWLGDPEAEAGAESAYFLSANRGKRSLTVDLSDPEGQSLVRSLASEADILVENFRVGGLARFGLDYATLAALNPRLVYCAITGFGQTGPDADRAGYDAMIQAAGGLMSITGEADGQPQKVGVAVADLMCGMYAASGILAALFRARETGRGDYIDLSLFDSQLAWLANQSMNYLLTGVSPRRQGSAHPNIVPYQPFACADGSVMLAIGNDRQFRRWCEAAGIPELGADSRFRSNQARVENRAELIRSMAPIMASRTASEWLAECERLGIPCGPINSIGEAFSEPQVTARGARFSMGHPLSEHLPQVANPLRFNNQPIEYRRPPPTLGQHTREILEEMGLSSEKIEALRDSGVV